MKLTKFALAIGLALSASVSQALVISDDSDQWGPNSGFFIIPLDGLASFDSSLGKLKKATITLNAQVQSSLMVENQNTSATTVTFTLDSEATLTTCLSGAPASVNAQLQKAFSLSAFDQLLDFGGTSGAMSGTLTGNLFTTSFATTDPLDLLLLTGTGDLIGWYIDTVTHSSSDVTQNIFAGLFFFDTIASVHIDYEYDPVRRTVPEPGALGLLGLGLAGLGAISRKRS